MNVFRLLGRYVLQRHSIECDRPENKLVCIFALVLGNSNENKVQKIFSNDPVVKVSQGFVRGIVANSTKGRPFYSFRGIPYGEPPVGDLRFKAPIEVRSWKDTFNATENSVKCTQVSGTSSSVVGDENCLKLNVYTPSLTGGGRAELLPVLVFISGGGFASETSSSNVFGPDRYMDKDVVVVLMNYRVGPFGFLSTGDDAASGNWGLLDQVLALKWVKANIAVFGGDSARVTISGQSAGSASVMYHVISPAAKGLFRGAIAESGSPISLFGLQRKPLESAKCLGEILFCRMNDTAELVDCLRSKDSVSLVKATIEMQSHDCPVFPFLPVVENTKTGQFLIEHPIKLLENGKFNKVPVISGLNKEDGTLTYEAFEFAYRDISETFFNDTLPVILLAMFDSNSSLLDVSYAIKAEYYDNIDTTNASQVVRASIDLNTDALFTYVNDLTIRLLSKSGVPVYAYVFGYPGSASKHNYSGEIEVSHGDELSYLFDTGVILNDQDQAVSDTLIDMWINFTYSLDPTPTGTWKPNTIDDNNKYLIISRDLKMQDGYRTEQMKFWNTQVTKIMGVIEQIEPTTTAHPGSANVIFASQFLIIVSIYISMEL